MADHDIIVYGATGYTGRLVAEHMLKAYGAAGDLSWAMAGRSGAKLAEVRGLIGAPDALPLVVADAADPASLAAMAHAAKAIITTVGPYQLYGDGLVAACADAGTDYVDLTGESHWIAAMIAANEAKAKASGARIVFSCGFDSIPFDLGVFFLEEEAKQAFRRAGRAGARAGARPQGRALRRHAGQRHGDHGRCAEGRISGRGDGRPVRADPGVQGADAARRRDRLRGQGHRLVGRRRS